MTAIAMIERARTAIELGESHFREFKSALEGPPGVKTPRAAKEISTNIAQTLVAFANADGGELLVGVEDNGEVTGLDQFSEKDIQILELAPVNRIHSDTPLPSVKRARLVIDDKIVLYFAVPKSVEYVHVTSDGRCLLRRDLESAPVASESIHLDRRERRSREYDREFVDGVSADDLDLEQVKIVADQILKGMSAEKCLQYLDLAEYGMAQLRLRRASLLLFSKTPAKWHPRLQVRILRVEGETLMTGEDYNVVADQIIDGNILSLVDKAWEALRPHLVQTKFDKGGRFEQRSIYPELACREALLNSIAHRDYSDEGRATEVFVFSEHLEIKNPGPLLSSIRIEDLMRQKGVHQSRNTHVARVLRELGYMRELGEGMRRIYELMHSNELSPPKIESRFEGFSIELTHKAMYSTKEMLWLSQFEDLGLDREQKAVVLLGQDARTFSPQNIWEAVGIVDTEHYRKLVDGLMRHGILANRVPKEFAKRASNRSKIPFREYPRFGIDLPKPTSPSISSQIDEKIVDDALQDAPISDGRRLHIGNLPFHLNKSDLMDCLIKYGDILELRIPMLRGSSKGFAWVEYETVESAESVLNSNEPILLDDRNLNITLARPRRSKR
ncbi:ATP-binding protein [Xanthomonas arboricola]|uniref:ATP-binding protein n=1 Tax=Xanthomonas arboricola TaxID=56448 RepID=UPI000F8CF8E0|nr:ATP-binding protein [Xanthomonas arboricola]